MYMGTSLIKKTPLLGPYSRTILRVLWRSYGAGGGLFLMIEVHLCQPSIQPVQNPCTSHLSTPYEIVDLYRTSPDFGERQKNSRTCTRQIYMGK